MNSLLLDALAQKNGSRPPVWLMRQAGRYMPSYQTIRKKLPLLEMFHDPDVMTEVTLLPIRELQTDAAILFADILSVLDGLSIAWDFVEGQGPVIPHPVTEKTTLTIQSGVYGHTQKAITALKRELKVPLLGFAGAPFTVASYLIEGGSSKDLRKTKTWAAQNSTTFHALLEKITEATIAYLKVQIESGVDAIQLFDSWAHQLSLQDFRTFCLPYLKKILKTCPVPSLVFCRGSCFFAKDLATLPLSGISLDWSLPMEAVRKEIPSTLTLQGNLDPCILFAGQDAIRRACDPLLDSMKGDKGFIFNLGHGILPQTPYENVKFLVDYVQSRKT